jgi:hypothetical protein
MKTREWAALVAAPLTDEQLSELTSLLDNDIGNQFFLALNEVNARRNPQEYVEVALEAVPEHTDQVLTEKIR